MYQDVHCSVIYHSDKIRKRKSPKTGKTNQGELVKETDEDLYKDGKHGVDSLDLNTDMKRELWYIIEPKGHCHACRVTYQCVCAYVKP